MLKEKFDIIITTDRTMMTDHHGKEFLGFITTGPPLGLPEKLWMWLAAPKMKTDSIGKPRQAPYGLRKIEATLINAGFKAAIIDPDYLHLHLKHAKILMIGHHDYFAMGPPSNEWWLITRKEPINAKSFRKFMEKPEIREAKKRGLKIIVGGPAAWQWLWKIDYWKKWDVDTVVDGESEKIIVPLVEKALNGEKLPRYIYVGVSETPKLNEIPLIKHASVNGLIEVMRGCPRGCKFCPVTLRPLRHYTLDMIEEELKVNAKEGLKHGVIHSEDVLLYGASGVIPNPNKVLILHKLVKKYYHSFAWSHITPSTLKYAQEKFRLITKLTELVYDENQEYIGVEVGIETGSPRLAKLIMPGKTAPYPPEKWPEIVEDAFSIMHEHNIVPAGTVILGLPGETTEDIIATLELLDRLKYYRSLIVPMFFVPMGMLKNENWFELIRLREEHVEVLKKCLWHSLKWAKNILEKFYLKESKHMFVRAALKAFIKYVESKAKVIEKTYLKTMIVFK